jgi:hypothetical protein
LYGNQKCAFVPLFGHASTEEDQLKIYRTLYLHASKNWLKNKRLSWVITSFEHNQDLEKFWFKNGFGQRCADAIALPQASKEEVEMVPDSVVKILCQASLQTKIKRFSVRFNGHMPKPVEAMMKRKDGMFNGYDYDLLIDGEEDIDANVSIVLDFINSKKS